VSRGTMGVNSVPKTVTRRRRGCDLNPGPSAPESSTLTTRLPSQRNVGSVCCRLWRCQAGRLVYSCTTASQSPGCACTHSHRPTSIRLRRPYRIHCSSLVNHSHSHRRRLHWGNREVRPGTHARTGANVAFCPGTFHGRALIF